MSDNDRSKDIEAKVIAIVAEVLRDSGINPSQIKPESNFVTDLKAASIDLYAMIVAMEDEFGLGEIPDEDAENIQTVQNVIDYIEEHLPD